MERHGGAATATGGERRERVPEGWDTSDLFREYARTGELAFRDELVRRHDRLVHALARRFVPVGITAIEDLVQVGRIGLIQAVERFDVDAGFTFLTFATPTVLGIMRRYLRDCAWPIWAPRRLRELAIRLRRARGRLEQDLGRAPSTQELADAEGVEPDQVLEALEVAQLYTPASLERRNPTEGWEEDDTLDRAYGQTDQRLAAFEEREAVHAALACLDSREREIITFRFYGGATQAEVARRLGISQMHVSRLERRALDRLRELLR